jgi:superfamily I DNA and RNA helicase
MIVKKPSLQEVIKKRDKILHGHDFQLEEEAKKIPPGPQRIRGVAGSGKTRLLCQKAAYIHAAHPEWTIAYIFFSRSLYDEITRNIEHILASLGKKRDPNQLQIMHAWGASGKPGLLNEVRKKHNLSTFTVEDVNTKFKKLYPHGFIEGCDKTNREIQIFKEFFDALLIDEAQDMVINKDDPNAVDLIKKDKQPFFKLAYNILKPVDQVPNIKRIIWAYDEYQNINSFAVPSGKEIFGDNPVYNNILTGQYIGKIPKNILMIKSYRTPGSTLMAAHSICMGLMSPKGMIAGPTTQEEWRALGYEINGAFKPNTYVTLNRPEENSRNIIPKIFPDKNLIKFQTFASKLEEYRFIAQEIKKNIEVDLLEPSRQILIISLAKPDWALKKIAGALAEEGINYYIAAAPDINTLQYNRNYGKPSQFRMGYAVTLSQVSRAKGNESDVVYVADVDRVAKQEQNPNLRNLIFTAMTRTKGFVTLTGTGDYPMYDEIRNVLGVRDSVQFKFIGKPRISRDITEELKDEGMG